jgi:catechol 2,3-dioxygenase-like lactoylglutathione lyase family enzyme
MRSPEEAPVSRLQLALNVDDLDAAVAFCSALLSAEPAERRPGYANFGTPSRHWSRFAQGVVGYPTGTACTAHAHAMDTSGVT